MVRNPNLRHGGSVRPDKRLGQHFLIDRAICERIIGLAHFQPSDWVLEIGPGKGALTLPLAREVSRVVAVEKDKRLAEGLQQELVASGISNVDLVCQDILRLDFDAIPLPPSGRIQVIGNLPYNISSPVLGTLTRQRERLGRAVLMFQREVADRLTAAPNSKGYGALTLLVRYHARPTPLLPVSRMAFRPAPKVDSMVIELDFAHPYPSQGVGADDFRKVVRAAFAHRRKTLLNSLRGTFPGWTAEALTEVLREGGIDPRRRAESLAMDEFLALTSILAVDKGERG